MKEDEQMKSEDRIITAIRSRKDLEPVKISLRKLLASGGMEHYLNLCSDRLADELMIDGEDTAFNFADFPDILFTSDGFFDCRHILENYLPLDTLADTWQLLRETERKTNDYSEQEAKQLICQWIAMELWSRTFFSDIWRKPKEVLLQIYVSWKYRGLFDIMRTVAEKYN